MDFLGGFLDTPNPDEMFVAEILKNEPECYFAKGLKSDFIV